MSSKFFILYDNKEQNPWRFIKSDYCEGSERAHLKTGDYTLRGYEDQFVIEKKATASELYNNLCTNDFKRFEKELIRLTEIPHAFILCEFTMNDIYNFPNNSNLPPLVKKKIGNKSSFFLSKFLEIQVKYNIPIILAGAQAKQVALSLFKRIKENVKNNSNTD